MTIAALVSVAVTHALADPACDHAVAIADANAALMSAPDLFLSAGSMPRGDSDEAFEPRLVGGVDYSLTRILAGSATRARATAECRARAAAERIETGPLARALDARIASLATAIADGESALARVESAAVQQLATRPELVAMRIDLDALRAQLASARRERAALPAPSTLAHAVADERAALADLEGRESRLRTLDGIDISVRGAIDRGISDTQAYVAIVSVTFDTGLWFRGDANDRAARARADLARARLAALDAQVTVDGERIAQLDALIASLEQERTLAARLSGDDARRFERQLWRELATRKAEHAFLVSRVSATQELHR
ncbi:MAG: hypothetical protein ACKV2T_12375 [Kofleriaceae bacterium]